VTGSRANKRFCSVFDSRTRAAAGCVRDFVDSSPASEIGRRYDDRPRQFPIQFPPSGSPHLPRSFHRRPPVSGSSVHRTKPACSLSIPSAAGSCGIRLRRLRLSLCGRSLEGPDEREPACGAIGGSRSHSWYCVFRYVWTAGCVRTMSVAERSSGLQHHGSNLRYRQRHRLASPVVASMAWPDDRQRDGLTSCPFSMAPRGPVGNGINVLLTFSVDGR